MTSPACSNDFGLTLAVCGCEERLQFVLGRSGPHGLELRAAQSWAVPGQGLRFLAPALKQALDLLGQAPASLARLVAVCGPGSFTGIRLALAALSGLAAATRAPTLGLDYLPLLAEAPARVLTGHVLVLTHARSRLVYAQPFLARAGLPAAEPLGPVQVLALDSALALARSLPGPLHLLGSGLRRAPDECAALAAGRPGLVLLPPAWDNPQPEILLEAALAASLPMEPLYLRPSDAEENLAAIAAARGVTAEEARKVLAKPSIISSLKVP